MKFEKVADLNVNLVVTKKSFYQKIKLSIAFFLIGTAVFSSSFPSACYKKI